MIRRLTQSVKDRWLRFKGHDESPAKRREMRFEAMEDRILLSADFGIEPQTSQFDSGLSAHPEIAIVDIDQQYDEAKTAQSLAAADGVIQAQQMPIRTSYRPDYSRNSHPRASSSSWMPQLQIMKP